MKVIARSITESALEYWLLHCEKSHPETYGIAIKEGNDIYIEEDIDEHLPRVERLFKNIVNGELSPCHLGDIAEDHRTVFR